MRIIKLVLALGASVTVKASSSSSSFDGPFRVDKFPQASYESIYFFDWNETAPGSHKYLAGITGLSHKSGDHFYAITELEDDPSYFWTLDIDNDSPPKIPRDATRLSVPDTYGHPGGNANLESPQAIAFKEDSDLVYISHDKDVITRFYRDSGLRHGNINYASDISLHFDHGKGLESLSFDVSRSHVLWTASEAGSFDDGNEDWVRFIAIDTERTDTLEEYVYRKDDFHGNGVVSIIALDYDGTFLVLERVASGHDYSVDHSVRLYFAFCDKTLDVAGYTGLDEVNDVENFLQKYELLDLGDLEPYNDMYHPLNVGRFESMALRYLDDHKARIVLVSNNGFQEHVKTQVLTIDLDIDLIGVVEPEGETDTISGSPYDAAVSAKAWVHPEDPRSSLVFGTLAKSGLGVYTLGGNELARIQHAHPVEYHGLDLIYGFKLYDGSYVELVDLVVVTNMKDGTIVVFKIDPDVDDGHLEDITDADPPHISYPRALATYTSPFDGRSYVFVSSNGDKEIIQLRLTSDGYGKVHVEKVQRHGGDIDLQGKKSFGMVVDREFGWLYASVTYGGIWKWDAEPYELSSGSSPVIVDEHRDYVGLDIYYGEEYDGYLIASFRGDSSFAVFERDGGNDFLAWFSVGPNYHLGIDKTDQTEGLGLINVNLGPEFSCGLMMVQDAAAQNPDYVVKGNTVRNSKTNFKLVPFENLEKSLPHHLTIDTQTWGPRRFALVRLVDTLSQQVYSALHDGHITPRDAQELLGLLGEAAFYLYKPGSMLRRLMSPTGGRREFNSYKYPLNRRRHLRRGEDGPKNKGSRRLYHEGGEYEEESPLRIPLCPESKGKGSKKSKSLKSRRNYMTETEEELQDFVSTLNFLGDQDRVDDGSKNYWVDLAQAIIVALPAEIEYYNPDRS